MFSCHSGSVTFPSSVLRDHRTLLSPTGDYTRALEPSFQDNENANIAEGSFSRQRSARHNLHCTEMTFGFWLDWLDTYSSQKVTQKLRISHQFKENRTINLKAASSTYQETWYRDP